jgi:hypothetical protein
MMIKAVIQNILLLATMAMLIWLGFVPDATAQTAQWTFMVYLDGDNDLETHAITDFLEMASVGSDTATVNILVLFDRIRGYSSAYGDWVGARRGRVDPDDVPDTTWGISLGEVNMGDPQTLIDFVEWGMQNHPADRYAVVFWDHGSGWHKTAKEDSIPFKNVCGDDTDGDVLLMQEVRNALQTIEADEQQPDLLGFDACLMSMVEVAYEIRQLADVMVASERIIPYEGWPYDTILGDLKASPAMSAAQLGSAIVSRYYQSHVDHETLAAIQLAAMDDVATRTDLLALRLRNDWNSNVGACLTAAYNVKKSIEAAIISEAHGSSWPGSHGLSIYFPEFSGDFNNDYNGTQILFPLDTQWEDFLSDYYASISGSWVGDARNESQEYDANGSDFGGFWYVDLYDFCERLTLNAPGITWVDFNYSGTEYGTFHQPYDTLGEGIAAVSSGEIICIKSGSSSETMAIAKELSLRAYGGTAIIGQ